MKTNASQKRRDGPLVPKLLTVHRALTSKAPRPPPPISPEVSLCAVRTLGYDAKRRRSLQGNDNEAGREGEREGRTSVAASKRSSLEGKRNTRTFNIYYGEM